jgi:phospholipase/carboxylesterase
MSKIIQSRLAGLQCYIMDTEEAESSSPDLLVVCCHGYGAPGHDLVGLGAEIVQLNPELSGRVRFIFPEAPLAAAANPYGGRAWWQIDLDALEAALSSGSHRQMQRDCPDGMTEARRTLLSLIDEALQMTGLNHNQLVLAGFSQGAMLATDIALRLEDPPAGLVILSGTCVNLDDWEERMPKRAGLRVLQSHGRQDPLLAFSAAEELHGLMKNAGLDAHFLPFDGQHTISEESLARFSGLLTEILKTI